MCLWRANCAAGIAFCRARSSRSASHCSSNVVPGGVTVGSKWRVGAQDRSTSGKEKAPISSAFATWRVPNSNRGHRDFQRYVKGLFEATICSGFAEAVTGSIPVVLGGFLWV
jgi:hypothetical protein